MTEPTAEGAGDDFFTNRVLILIEKKSKGLMLV
jgi:hypothetical protein